MSRKIKFYTDEHVARAVVKGIRQRGIDVVSVAETGKLGDPDEDHLAYARTEGRVIFTQDDDFLALSSAGAEHAGIVYARQHTPVGMIVHGLLLIYNVLDAEEMVNHIEFL